MKLMTKINLIMLVIFGTGAFLIAQLAHSFLLESARSEVLQQARLMMAGAESVRNYTANDLSPLLEQNPRHRVRFLAETIPFYGATTTFNSLRRDNPDYMNYAYQEAALNPTNLQDRAADWQSDIIYEFRNHPEISQLVNVRSTSSGPSLYIANPIKVKQECLECHSTPSAAPHAMITVYGSQNGFGWKKDDIIGAQIISVPMAVPVAIANHAYQRLLVLFGLTMVLTMLALDAGVYLFIIRPLKLVSDAADRISRGDKNVPPIKVKGKDEVSTVAASLNRMQVSLAKALRMLDEE